MVGSKTPLEAPLYNENKDRMGVMESDPPWRLKRRVGAVVPASPDDEKVTERGLNEKRGEPCARENSCYSRK